MTTWLERLLRLPPLPTPEPGEEVLHPAARQLSLDAFGWTVKQAGAFVGILISIAFLRGIELPFAPFLIGQRVFDSVQAGLSHRFPDLLPGPWTLSIEQVVWIVEGIAIAGFLVQLVVSGLLLRLAFESRVYLVGDERVRLREGIFTVREQTFTVANIQNLLVQQGPLQRLLGFADLEISTAGGGERGDDKDKPSLHLGRLRSLEDAPAVRDRLRAALESHRHSGLGDTPAAPVPARDASLVLLAAANDLVAEAKALRQSWGR